MSKVLFNIDDLALILVISSSLIFITILSSDFKEAVHKRYLSGFLACIAIASLNIILYWSPIIRTEFTTFQPHVFLVFQTAWLSAAPVLYLYTKSLIYKDFHFSKKDLLHFGPALVYVGLLPVIYGTMGTEQIKQSALDYQALDNNPIFWFFTWLQHLVKLGYGFGTLQMLQHHKTQLQEISSNTDEIDGNWLKLMVMGFLCLWVMQASSQIFHEFQLADIAQFTALFSNYFLFGLVSLLVILSLTRSTAKASKSVKAHDHQVHEYTDEQVNRLERTIAERQPHLKSDLTLEELSKVSSIPQRTLSVIINRHHGKNFFEYINEHRVHRAAELLLSNQENLSMLDIMEESGFNSKSAFNRFFKKSKGMTPTQFKASQKNNDQ